MTRLTFLLCCLCQGLLAQTDTSCAAIFKIATNQTVVDWQRKTVIINTIQNGKTIITERDSALTGRITLPFSDGKAESILTFNKEYSKIESKDLNRNWQFRYVDSSKHKQFFTQKTIDTTKYTFSLVTCKTQKDTLWEGEKALVFDIVYTTAYEGQEAFFTQSTLWLDAKSRKVHQIHSKITDRDGKMKETTLIYDRPFFIPIPETAQPFVKE